MLPKQMRYQTAPCPVFPTVATAGGVMPSGSRPDATECDENVREFRRLGWYRRG